MKTKIELAQKIGDEVCEGCGEYSDCGEEPSECLRVINAVALIDEYMARAETED